MEILFGFVVFILFLATVSFLVLRKLGISKLLSIIVSLPLTLILANVVVTVISDCSASYYLKSELKNNLSESEYSTLKPTSVICPIEYAYMRNGKKEQALVLTGLRPKIIYADENHQP